MTPVNRLIELDFLRGIAILLVLLSNKHLTTFTSNMGWIGVDLFFTLSGFLVSGLLFKEYLKFGDINPGKFLIRRGFKIYPIYYFSYPLYIIPALLNGTFNEVGFLSDMVFLQNYIWGWGYAYTASWSLAVEEHFYFGLAISLWLGIKYNIISFGATYQPTKGLISFQILIFSIFGLCLLLRFIFNSCFPEDLERNFTMTHLRIDSLMAGVYIAYLFYFKRNTLEINFNQYKYLLLGIAFLFLTWTPFTEPVTSFFVKTIGFTLLYISFGVILVFFILNPRINETLNNLFSAPIVNIVSKIGYCSYSVYIIHILINNFSSKFISYIFPNNHYVEFAVAFAASILAGMFMTYYIESYFLKIRNRYVPSRVE